MPISEALKAQLLAYQTNEITEHHIYRRLAETMREPENARIVREIADDELRHYEQWKTYSMAALEYLSTQTEDTARNPIKASIYTGRALILGLECDTIVSEVVAL